ncbi:hypothetical protein BKA93DRAFT_747263 [Sparassis latifolia]
MQHHQEDPLALEFTSDAEALKNVSATLFVHHHEVTSVTVSNAHTNELLASFNDPLDKTYGGKLAIDTLGIIPEEDDSKSQRLSLQKLTTGSLSGQLLSRSKAIDGCALTYNHFKLEDCIKLLDNHEVLEECLLKMTVKESICYMVKHG